MEEKINNRPKTGLIVLIVIIALIIIGVLVYLVFYFVNKSARLEGQLSASSTATTSTTSPTPTSVASTETPKSVTESFMKYTLGTLPDASVDLTAAREYMDSTLNAQYPSDDFVPLFYGIQDGPTEVEYLSENTTGDSSSVKYNATFGDTMLGWVFTLTKTSDGWKISGFTNDAQ